MNEQNDVFPQAKDLLKNHTRQIIDSLPLAGGKWKGNEYWCCNPLRDDKRPDSFSISADGLYNDFATKEGGDLIDLLARMQNIKPVEAAKQIIDKYGTPYSIAKEIKPQQAQAFQYRNADGSPAFTIYRKGKDFSGSPIPDKYKGPEKSPLYNLPDILKNSDKPVLLVEGEKCASVPVPGYISTCWRSGVKSWDQTDFSPLTGRTVYLWPDNDQPGKEVMQSIADLLKHKGCFVKYINPPAGKPEKWDIADAAGEGMDLLSIINTAEPIQPREEKNRFLKNIKSLKDAFDKRPEINWPVESLIIEKSITIIAADSGGGKTFTVIDMGVCFAMGKPWLNHSVKQGNVLYLDEENGHNTISDRIEACARAHGGGPNTPFYYESLQAINLQNSDDLQDIEETIKALNIKMLILDSLIEVKGGAKENEADDMNPVFSALRKLANDTDCLIIILHHKAKNGTSYRGSGAIKSSCDCMLVVNKRGDHLTFESEKMRHGAPVSFSANMIFGEESVHEGGKTLLKKTFLLESTGSGLKNDTEDIKRPTPNEAMILSALRHYPDGARADDIVKETGKSIEAVKKALQRLKSKGDIIQPEKGVFKLPITQELYPNIDLESLTGQDRTKTGH